VVGNQDHDRADRRDKQAPQVESGDPDPAERAENDAAAGAVSDQVA
jgi:hypothetical protein